MDRITFILIALLVWILTIILVIVVLNLINNKEKKKLKAEIEKLEKEKNMVISASMLSELNKVEALVNNDEMKEKLDDWKARFNDIKEKGLYPKSENRQFGLEISLNDNKELIIKGTREDFIELSDLLVSLAISKNNDNHFHIDELTLIDDNSSIKEIIVENK